MVNPMLVEGQIRGGGVQGLGTALYEEIPYDETGQPLAGTLADYLLPGAEVNETSITPRRVMAAIRKAGEAAPKP